MRAVKSVKTTIARVTHANESKSKMSLEIMRDAEREDEGALGAMGWTGDAWQANRQGRHSLISIVLTVSPARLSSLPLSCVVPSLNSHMLLPPYVNVA